MLDFTDIITYRFKESFNYNDSDIQTYLKEDLEKLYYITATYNPTENVSKLIWTIKHKNKSYKPMEINFLYYLRFDLLINPIIFDYYNYGFYNKYYLIIKLMVGNKFILHSLWKDYTDEWYNNMTNNYFIKGNRSITLEQSILLNKLLKGEIVKLESEHNLVYQDDIGKYAMIIDKNKINAIIKIQRYWRRSRYNPKFNMCQIVQINNLKEEGIFLLN